MKPYLRILLTLSILVCSSTQANSRELPSRYAALRNPGAIRPGDSATLQFAFHALRGDSEFGLFSSTYFDPSRYGCGHQLVLEGRSALCELPVRELDPFVLLDLHYKLGSANSVAQYTVSIREGDRTTPLMRIQYVGGRWNYGSESFVVLPIR